ncbi:SDR family oxidoreductase [Actinocorallia sp. API 0066]|uniref:SDR family NAD(P)-dependent oxidoreductase n=1 Tax=Actinocorallia sp. API 0066 TaxID=2896846 RepID=UPI001E43CCA5|nr:SDR family oxidoreductase [Actinocorallia sp. API 0066]MCD0452089.1 SDR family oxidoreductase [Actinocorallia sp. API 0066]
MGYLGQLFGLDGKVALVTGGSSGIGRAVAVALGRAGASVVVVARGADALTATVAELEAHGCRAAAERADLANRDEVRDVAERAVGHFGEVDVLVNSAGVNPRPHLDDLTEADWDLTMAVNLHAPFLLGQRFGPAMAGRGWGRIINVGSQQAFRAFLNSGGYGVSKAGITALSRSQAEAWSARGVCANTLVPGFVRTPLTHHVAADALAALAARTTVGRNGLPEDFAGAAVFLASASSGYITGQTLFVDGGLSTH